MIVILVSADGIELKGLSVHSFVMKRTGSEQVAWHFVKESGRERAERFGIGVVRESVTFQRAGDSGKVDASLGVHVFLRNSPQGR